MAQPSPRVNGTKVLARRPANRGPCNRCGHEMEYRKDRPDRLCRDCVSVDPEWSKR